LAGKKISECAYCGNKIDSSKLGKSCREGRTGEPCCSECFESEENAEEEED